MSTDQTLQHTVDAFLRTSARTAANTTARSSELRLLVAFATEHHASRLVRAHPGVAGAVPRLASPITTAEL